MGVHAIRKEPESERILSVTVADECHGQYEKRTFHRHLCTLGVYEPSFGTQHQPRNRTIAPAFLDIVYLIT
jgi:hypothetical protein